MTTIEILKNKNNKIITVKKGDYSNIIYVCIDGENQKKLLYKKIKYSFRKVIMNCIENSFVTLNIRTNETTLHIFINDKKLIKLLFKVLK